MRLCEMGRDRGEGEGEGMGHQAGVLAVAAWGAGAPGPHVPILAPKSTVWDWSLGMWHSAEHPLAPTTLTHTHCRAQERMQVE